MLEGEKLYLLPVKGSDTHWCKNVLRNPQIALAQQWRRVARRSHSPSVGQNVACD